MRLSLSGPANSKQHLSMSFRLDHPSLTNSVASVHLDRGVECHVGVVINGRLMKTSDSGNPRMGA
jgi:hypothetical protein